MKNVKKYLDMNGHKVTDKVTGFKGVVTAVSFDLYGCVQLIVSPEIDKDGKKGDVHWFDVGRLKITSNKPVMDQPDFESVTAVSEGKKGPAEKPVP